MRDKPHIVLYSLRIESLLLYYNYILVSMCVLLFVNVLASFLYDTIIHIHIVLPEPTMHITYKKHIDDGSDQHQVSMTMESYNQKPEQWKEETQIQAFKQHKQLNSKANCCLFLSKMIAKLENTLHVQTTF